MSTMSVEIRDHDLKFLATVLPETLSARVTSSIQSSKRDINVLVLDKKDFGTILDSLFELMMMKGLCESNEPNAVGFRIERLVDMFSDCMEEGR